MPTDEQKAWCVSNAATAERLYVESLTPQAGAKDWAAAITNARCIVDAALAYSDNFQDVKAALMASGAHMRVFRHALAPPKSQDQFKILCPDWIKSSEDKGSGLTDVAATACAKTIALWRDRGLLPWIDQSRKASTSELGEFKAAVAALLASQEVSTATRTRLASSQETQVVDMLKRTGWLRLPSKTIDKRADLPVRHFMYKTRFATETSAPQEVDVACGLPDTVVLAMECKVTNDHTNSVKRINDILKKATAWKNHWGNFVQTAAMLQGVINPRDVERLLDSGVLVFWSHDMSAFETWLKIRCVEK